MAKQGPTIDALIGEADKTMDTICQCVAGGGSLIDLCQTWDVGYGSISNWIRKDKARSERYQAALLDRGEWFVERVGTELKKLGLSDIRQAFDDKGNLKPVHEWPEDVARAIQSVEVLEEFEGKGSNREFIGYTKRVKFWDKTKSLELIGKSLKMFIDKVEHTGSVSLVDLVSAAATDDDPIA